MMQGQFTIYRPCILEDAGKALDSTNVYYFQLQFKDFVMHLWATRSQTTFSQVSKYSGLSISLTIHKYSYAYMCVRVCIYIYTHKKTQPLMAYVAISNFCVCTYSSTGQRNLNSLIQAVMVIEIW